MLSHTASWLRGRRLLMQWHRILSLPLGREVTAFHIHCVKNARFCRVSIYCYVNSTDLNPILLLSQNNYILLLKKCRGKAKMFNFKAGNLCPLTALYSYCWIYVLMADVDFIRLSRGNNSMHVTWAYSILAGLERRPIALTSQSILKLV